MSKQTDTWMPLVVDKYLGDTQHLTTQQHGAYLLLLMAMWKSDGRLPSDDQRLRQITRLDPPQWKSSRAVLLEFFTTDGEWVTQKRLTEELQKAKANAEAKAKAGAAGAAKRWQKESHGDGESYSRAIADASRTVSQTGAPIPIPSSPDGEELSEGANAPSSSAEPTASPPTSRKPKATPEIPPPFDAIVDAYHDILPELPRVRLRDGKAWEGRKKAMRAMWHWVLTSLRSDGMRRATTGDEALAWMRQYFERARHNDWVMGREKRGPGHEGWEADLDYLLSEKGKVRVIEKTREAA